MFVGRRSYTWGTHLRINLLPKAYMINTNDKTTMIAAQNEVTQEI